MKVTFEDEGAKEKIVYEHSEGIVDYLRKIVAERAAKPVHDLPFTLTRDEGLRLDLVLQWTEATDEHVRSYVNGIPTGSGGTHESGLRAGIGKAVRNFIETHNLSPKGVTLTSEDIREGLSGVLSVFIAEPQFQGQTKDRLNNPELVSAIDGLVRPGLEHWLNHNSSVAEAIVGRIVLAARAREASRAAQAEVSRKSATSTRLNLPGKLSDCTNSSSGTGELFIVEGDSAGGSAKQGRDRARQAILPLRGKVLNTESASLAKVLENRGLADLVTAIGCGLGSIVPSERASGTERARVGRRLNSPGVVVVGVFLCGDVVTGGDIGFGVELPLVSCQPNCEAIASHGLVSIVRATAVGIALGKRVHVVRRVVSRRLRSGCEACRRALACGLHRARVRRLRG